MAIIKENPFTLWDKIKSYVISNCSFNYLFYLFNVLMRKIILDSRATHTFISLYISVHFHPHLKITKY